MAKKAFLKDHDDIEILPITRGELVLDSSGNPAFSSNEFLATTSQPGLMSAEDKKRIDDLENTGPGANNKVAQVNTTTSDVYRLLFSETATDETKTEGARKSAKLTFNPSTGVLQTTALIGNLDGTYVNRLTGYIKATTVAGITSEDSLNTALGKLELKADTTYDLVKGAYDGDGTIENLAEILKVLKGISDTETIQAIVGKYLPLSGGTIGKGNSNSFPLTISSTSSYTGFTIETSGGVAFFRYQGGSTWGVTDAGWKNSYTLLHSGNIGEYAFIPRDEISSNTDANNLQNGVYLNATGNGTGNSNFPQSYSIISHFTQSYRYQSQISIGNPNVYVRRKIDTWSEWFELITNKNIGSQNVASATKLQTARTIWGQSFDGTGNINGDIFVTQKNSNSTNYDSGVIRFNGIFDPSQNFVQGPSIRAISAGSYGIHRLAIFQHNSADYTSESEVFSIMPNGNVGIGTTNPAYKLDVNGTARATGFIKSGSSDSYVLLGAGGHKAISDFMLKSDELTNNLTTITKSITLTKDWQDTGISINSANFPNGSGTYAVQVYIDNGNQGFWGSYFSGIMSVYIYATNASVPDDEIVLHHASHACSKQIYLKTKPVVGSTDYNKLYIACNTNCSSAISIIFKFKKLI